MVADPQGKIRGQHGVLQRILHAGLADPHRPVSQAEHREKAPLHRPLHLDGLIFDDRPDKIVSKEEAPGPSPAEKQQGLEIRQSVVQSFAAGAAIDQEIRTAPLQPRADGGQGVRVVLLHRQSADMGEVLRRLHRIEIPDQQVRLDTLPQADLIARVGGNDKVAGITGTLPQSVKTPGGENDAAFHRNSPCV